MSDRVSQMFQSASAQGLKGRKEFIEVYILNRSVFVIVYSENIIATPVDTVCRGMGIG
jgi:hypothetical protein